MQGQQENELVALDLVSLDLIQHGLSFLKENKGFFILLLGDKVDGRFVELVDHHWHLVFLEI